jgi:hypothetical protein
MWRLAVLRQHLVLVTVGLVVLDASAAAAAIGALHRADTFARFSSALFEETRTLADALDRGVHGSGACLAAVVLYAAVRPWPVAWLRAAYVRALATSNGLTAPPWRIVRRLVLLDVAVMVPLSFGIGLLEKADLAALGEPVLLSAVVCTLYADYAIVVDDIGIGEALRASFNVLARRPLASLAAVAAWLVVSYALAAALQPSFDGGATPLDVTVLVVGSGVLSFALDVCLITLYRATPPPPERGGAP